MKPEAQRIAIAEACGWKRTPEYDFSTTHGRIEVWGLGLQLSPDLPDYLNDINAMHEAEKVLQDPNEKGRLMAEYCIWKLPAVCHAYSKGHEQSINGSTTTYWLIHATAAQRAEAFLRTIRKWKDDENTVAP